MTSISVGTSVNNASLSRSLPASRTDRAHSINMLSETEIYDITETQLALQLHTSILAAVMTVTAPVPVHAAEPAHWVESSIDEFKRQAMRCKA